MTPINRRVSYGRYKLDDIFPDIKQIQILMEIFESDEEIADVLERTAVIISDKPRYMKVDNDDGSILIGFNHIRHSNAETRG